MVLYNENFKSKNSEMYPADIIDEEKNCDRSGRNDQESPHECEVHHNDGWYWNWQDHELCAINKRSCEVPLEMNKTGITDGQNVKEEVDSISE